jgi:hypothetical protein
MDIVAASTGCYLPRVAHSERNMSRRTHERTKLMNIGIVALSLSLAAALFEPAYAQNAPQPAPAPSTAPANADAAAQAAYFKKLLADLDPCAGPLELESKTSITPCVFVAGEAGISYGYASVNIPATLSASGLAGIDRSLNLFGHVVAYPAFTMNIGLTNNAQLSVVWPSSIETNSRIAAAGTGASDMQLSYKQLFFKNLTSKTLASFEVSYTAPTAGAPFGAATPSYVGQLIVGQGLPLHFGVALALPISYAVVSTDANGSNKYGYSFAPVIIPYWQSPGGTLVAVVASHSFSPNTTPLAFSVLQLLNRHVELGVTYGGINLFTNIAGPIPQIVHFNAAAYPRILSVNAYFLIGHSDIPPALVKLQELEKAKAAQPPPK